jgi:Phosphatase-1 catalytic subunit binding region
MGDDTAPVVTSEQGRVRTDKHVIFVDRPIVHYEMDWPCDDYRLARMGPWMSYAIARYRFKRRIDDFERRFGYILTNLHRDRIRNKVWKRYFVSVLAKSRVR